MELLERDAPMARLEELLQRVREGVDGACALVHGPAGIGKTSLVREFLARHAPPGAPLVAGCEPLYTPRPLGPLVDLAERFPPSVAAALHEAHTFNGLFPAVLGYLRDTRDLQLLVLEDIHWADTATLDFVRYAGRRLAGVRCLMLLTYRSDEVDAGHPLRRALGDLPAATTLRLGLKPLSVAAVDALAREARCSARGVFEATGGNPFYVTEVLAHRGEGVPLSVTDAVLARMDRLEPAARNLCEAVSVCPRRAERPMLEAMLGDVTDAADRCLQQGLLVARGDGLGFEHELVRETVQASLPAPRSRALHAAVFDALQRVPGVDPVRLVHHAEGAGLAEALERLAAPAARAAAARGAHREAARLYGLALALRQLTTAQRARLLEAHAHECLLTNAHEAAVVSRLEALALCRELGERAGEGVNLRWIARLHWLLGRDKAGARRLAREAIQVLQTLPPGGELAGAYSTLSHLYLVSGGLAAAQRWGLKAIALAQSLGDAEAQSHALNNVATARLQARPDEQEWLRLQRSLDLAQQHGLHADAARAHYNLFVTRALHRQFVPALRHAEDGIEYAEQHGVDVLAVRLRIRRAHAAVQTGRFDLAAADLRHIEQHHRMPRLEQPTFAFVQAVLGQRSGAVDAAEELARACDRMDETDAQLWFTSTMAARLESAWLRGEEGPDVAACRAVLRRFVAAGDGWRAGELAVWLARCGVAVAPLEALPLPHGLELCGQAREAAQAWARLGCPYDRALALCSGDEDDLREAVSLFDALGAGPAAEAARRRLRALGARGIRRGPLARTRDDPLGLTARERQVFDLLCQGLSNAAIAARLHRSERTVEHHVAAVLGKTGAATRVELIAAQATPAENLRAA